MVRDGHVFTGGGVTAGIDFVFTLMNEIAGPQLAQTHPPSMRVRPRACRK